MSAASGWLMRSAWHRLAAVLAPIVVLWLLVAWALGGTT
jgi:hypothetical protein